MVTYRALRRPAVDRSAVPSPVGAPGSVRLGEPAGGLRCRFPQMSRESAGEQASALPMLPEETRSSCQLQLQGEDESRLLTLSPAALRLLEGSCVSRSFSRLLPAPLFSQQLGFLRLTHALLLADCSRNLSVTVSTGYFTTNTSYSLLAWVAFRLLARADC